MMSNLKRPRTSEWGPEVGLPPDKRVVYSFESGNHGYGYEEQSELQIWPESHEDSYIYQDTLSEIMPSAHAFSDHSSSSILDLCQGQLGFNKELYQAREDIFYRGGQGNELSPSLPAAASQNAMEGMIFGNPNNDLPVESFVGTPEVALKTVDVCFGTVCNQTLSLSHEESC